MFTSCNIWNRKNSIYRGSINIIAVLELNRTRKAFSIYDVIVPGYPGSDSVNDGSKTHQNDAYAHQERMPRELVTGLLAPAEPGLEVEPPEENGHDGGGGGEGEDGGQCRQLGPAPFPHRDSVPRHLQQSTTLLL